MQETVTYPLILSPRGRSAPPRQSPLAIESALSVYVTPQASPVVRISSVIKKKEVKEKARIRGHPQTGRFKADSASKPGEVMKLTRPWGSGAASADVFEV